MLYIKLNQVKIGVTLKSSFAILDLECTGLVAGKHEILSSHVILFDGENLIDQMTNNFCPNTIREDYHKAYKIHRITIEQALKFPRKRDALISLLDFIPDYSVMVCHSKRKYFDYGFLAMEYEFQDLRIEFNRKFKRCISTHTMAAKYTKLKNLGLSNLCEYFGIGLDHHDAKSDSLACFELFKIFYNNHKYEIEKEVEYYL